jgi:hypothetical protein
MTLFSTQTRGREQKVAVLRRTKVDQHIHSEYLSCPPSSSTLAISPVFAILSYSHCFKGKIEVGRHIHSFSPLSS